MRIKKPIHMWTYAAGYRKEQKKLLSTIDEVLRSGQLILGKHVYQFEKEFARFCAARFGVGVGSGTDAIFIGLKTLDIGSGDEVITVPNTAIPTVSAICATGATPVFVDIDLKTYCINVNKIEEKITKATRCIIPVHLYGQCADMDTIAKIAKKHNLFVLEDCAHAHGASWRGRMAGSMSDIAAFSFYPTKVLGAFGDGGIIVTNRAKLAKKARMLRMYGIGRNYYAEMLGFNSRLDELHAAILRYKLKKLAANVKIRQKIAARYSKELGKTTLILPYTHAHASHAYYLYTLRHKKRNAIIEFMKKHHIQLGIHYKHPLHLMRAFRFLDYKKGDFPETERAAREIFSLPLYPELTEAEQTRIINVLLQFFRR